LPGLKTKIVRRAVASLPGLRTGAFGRRQAAFG